VIIIPAESILDFPVKIVKGIEEKTGKLAVKIPVSKAAGQFRLLLFLIPGKQRCNYQTNSDSNQYGCNENQRRVLEENESYTYSY
jgi:hypothetical protein